MVRLTIILLIGILNSAVAFGQAAEFSFDKKVLKFDPISEGTTLNMEFRFTNTGSEPLIISNYKVQCSCTKVTYPLEPVLPGEPGVIAVSFDSAGKIGWQYRTILLQANVPGGSSELEFQVKVKKR